MVVEVVEARGRVHLVGERVGRRDRDRARAREEELVVVVGVVHPAGAVLDRIEEAEVLAAKVVPAQLRLGLEGERLLPSRERAGWAAVRGASRGARRGERRREEVPAACMAGVR